jgi:hypothetical protein
MRRLRRFYIPRPGQASTVAVACVLSAVVLLLQLYLHSDSNHCQRLLSSRVTGDPRPAGSKLGHATVLSQNEAAYTPLDTLSLGPIR